MIKRGAGAAIVLLPWCATLLACNAGYSGLRSEIDAAVAAAQVQDSSAAARGTATAGTTAAAGTTATGGGVAGAASMTSPMAGPRATGTTMPSAPMASRVTAVANLAAPEAVAIDTAGGMLLVAGSEDAATGSRGVIARLDLDGNVKEARWIVGGVGGAILRAPRGMAIVGDTVWVADQTVLRAFSRKTGRPIISIPMGTSFGAVALSDVTVSPDNVLYVADAATTFSARGVPMRKGNGKIFRVDGRKVTVALDHARLVQPTTVSWDPIMNRLLVGSAASDTILAWRPGQSAPETAAVGSGPFDGIVAIGGTSFYALSAARGEVQHFENGMGRRVMDAARGAGDMAMDPVRGRLVVPFPADSRVEIWDVRR